VDLFYEKAGSLFVEAYDAFDNSRPQAAGDMTFYERVARGAATRSSNVSPDGTLKLGNHER
jgi:hypothetical protein